jgi:hypothetical protein
MKEIIKNEKYYIFSNVEELKEHVDIEDFISANFTEYPYDTGWAEPIEEDFAEILKYLGIDDVEFCWDVSPTQGRGASFTGRWHKNDMDYKKLKEYIPNETDILNIFNQIEDICYEYEVDYKEDYGEEVGLDYADITQCQHIQYCHSNTMCITLYDENGSYVEDRQKEELLDSFKELADAFFDSLEKEFDNVTSEVAIMEFIVNNEIEVPEKYLNI